MAVVRRGDVWQAQVRIGRDPVNRRWRTKSVTCDTKAKAVQAERALLAEAARQRARFVTPSSMPLGDLLQRWLEESESRYQPTTFDLYQTCARKHIVPALGTVRICDLSPSHMQGLLVQMGPRAITKQVKKVLVAALDFAAEQGWVEENMARRTRVPYTPANKRASYTLEEADAVLAAASQRGKYRHLFTLAMYTGLRRGEACGLRWEDITWEGMPSARINRQVVMVKGQPVVKKVLKSEAAHRDVPLIPEAVEALEAQRRATGSDGLHGWIFPGDSPSGTIRPTCVSASLSHFARRAGGRELPLHSFRHTAASLMLSSGTIDNEAACKVMGHASYDTFYRTYADLMKPAVADVGRKLADYVASQRRAQHP